MTKQLTVDELAQRLIGTVDYWVDTGIRYNDVIDVIYAEAVENGYTHSEVNVVYWRLRKGMK